MCIYVYISFSPGGASAPPSADPLRRRPVPEASRLKACKTCKCHTITSRSISGHDEPLQDVTFHRASLHRTAYCDAQHHAITVSVNNNSFYASPCPAAHWQKLFSSP